MPRRRGKWIAEHVLPHEPRVRRWLLFRVRYPDDVDDLVQEAYTRLAAIERFDNIDNPENFFLAIVRNLLIDHVRRERIVRIEAIDNVDGLTSGVDEFDPERIVGDRRELNRVMEIVASLPTRCQTIFRMRKIDGLSQREIAQRLDVSESVVENEGVKGLLLLARNLREIPGAAALLPKRLQR